MTQNQPTQADVDVAIVGTEPTDPSAEGDRDAIPQAEAETEPFLTTLFNHQPQHLDRNEAEQLVQMGLFSKPHIESLRYLAQLDGQKSIKDMLSAMVSAKENEIYSETAAKISDPELAREVAEDRIARLKGDLNLSDSLPEQSAADDKDSLNRRLAEEFVELQGEFGDAVQFSQLPDSVKRTAAEKGVALKYAYALHLCREQAKIDAASTAQSEAAQAATDSFKSDVSDGTSPEMAQVYKALWGN